MAESRHHGSSGARPLNTALGTVAELHPRFPWPTVLGSALLVVSTHARATGAEMAPLLLIVPMMLGGAAVLFFLIVWAVRTLLPAAWSKTRRWFTALAIVLSLLAIAILLAAARNGLRTRHAELPLVSPDPFIVALAAAPMTPTYPFPPAVDDAIEAWNDAATLRPDVPRVVAGDCAGGGLALSLIAALRDRGQPLPDAAFVLSPWTDLAVTGTSVAANEGKDGWTTRRHRESWRHYYVCGSDPAHPGTSPVNAELSGFPPLFLVVGDHELVLDDTLRVEARARSASVDDDSSVGRDMHQAFPVTLGWLKESREVWHAIIAFLNRTAR